MDAISKIPYEKRKQFWRACCDLEAKIRDLRDNQSKLISEFITANQDQFEKVTVQNCHKPNGETDTMLRMPFGYSGYYFNPKNGWFYKNWDLLDKKYRGPQHVDAIVGEPLVALLQNYEFQRALSGDPVEHHDPIW